MDAPDLADDPRLVEVDHPGLAVARQQILDLQVAVNDPRRVHRVDRAPARRKIFLSRPPRPLDKREQVVGIRSQRRDRPAHDHARAFPDCPDGQHCVHAAPPRLAMQFEFVPRTVYRNITIAEQPAEKTSAKAAPNEHGPRRRVDRPDRAAPGVFGIARAQPLQQRGRHVRRVVGVHERGLTPALDAFKPR